MMAAMNHWLTLLLIGLWVGYLGDVVGAQGAGNRRPSYTLRFVYTPKQITG